MPGEEDEVVSIGYLSYSMNVQSGTLGSMTSIQIISDHNMENIYPRLEFHIFPMMAHLKRLLKIELNLANNHELVRIRAEIVW